MLSPDRIVQRFGFGGPAGGRESADWLAGQLQPAAVRAEGRGLRSTAEASRDFPRFLLKAGLLNRDAQGLGPANRAESAAGMPRAGEADGPEQSSAARKTLEGLFAQEFLDSHQAEVKARLERAAITETPFAERLVWFWANHFTVSAARPVAYTLVGPFERDAIRPQVMGRFADMLLASSRHAGMLAYLDNQQSIGPDTPAATKPRRGLAARFAPTGLNENLAREILELHTLGVNGGYTQADVTELARALTGWRYSYLTGRFRFEDDAHAAGERTLLGKRYPAGGEAQARAMLDDLARHPGTARFVATKLARHFLADDPPAAAVQALAERFQQTDGDLVAVYRRLIELATGLSALPPKFTRPDEHVVAVMRSLAVRSIDGRLAQAALVAMGMPPFAAPSPQGWPDRQAAWLAPDALAKRIEFNHAAAQLWGRGADARALAEQLFGPRLSTATRTELARAESPVQALTLLCASPEFLFR